MSSLFEIAQKLPAVQHREDVIKLRGLIANLPDSSAENRKYFTRILDYLILLAQKEQEVDILRIDVSQLKALLKVYIERNNFLEEEILKYRTAQQIMDDAALKGYKNMLLKMIEEEGKNNG